MTNLGEIFDEHQPDNAEAWYLVDKVDPNDLDRRQIIMYDGEGFCVSWSLRAYQCIEKKKAKNIEVDK